MTRRSVRSLRPSHPAGCPTRCTGACSTACTPGCATGWWRWPPIPMTRPGVSSRRGSPGSPTASRPPRSCASAGSSSSAMSWAAPRCGTGPHRCGRRSRWRCGSRRPTRSLSCAAGWPMCWRRPAGGSGRTPASPAASSTWSSREPGARRSVPRRARRPGHRDYRAVGRRRDVEPAGAAPRARSAVHPHQRHGGRGQRRPGPARHHPRPGLARGARRHAKVAGPAVPPAEPAQEAPEPRVS